MDDHLHPLARLPSDQLRGLWMGRTPRPVDLTDREEALWEYWRRVAVGDQPFEFEELEAAFSVNVRGVENAVAELARCGRIPSERTAHVRLLLTKLPADRSVWATVQLDAREALDSLQRGASSGRGVLLEALLAKGASWAAIEAMEYLTEHERDGLLVAAEQRKVFSRGQRHELGNARAAFGRRGSP